MLELLHNEFKERTSIYPVFSLEEAKHTLLPRDNVIVSYVRELNGKKTHLQSKVSSQLKRLLNRLDRLFVLKTSTYPFYG